MPIKINLLAEAQAAEELRRKDPVKRAILAAILAVFATLAWSSAIQVKLLSRKGELNGVEAGWKRIEKDYQAAVENRRRALEAEEKLIALQQLTTNRFLWGTTLNALQQTLNGIDDVQVMRIKTEQTYVISDDPKHTAPGVKSPSATEKIVLTVDGLDASAQPGSKINKFKASIASEPFFQANLQKTNGVTLLSFSPPQMDAVARTPYVKFSLGFMFPEKVR
jgi:hypothetical protein